MNKSKTIILCALFAALISVGAFIKFNFFIIPITLQPFFVMLSGIYLGSKRGASSALIYLIIGLLGIPVFTTGGGISYIFTLTFGFIIGFVLSAFLIGLICERIKNLNFLNCFLACAVGVFSLYLVGVPYAIFIKTLYFKESIDILKFVWSMTSVYLLKDLITAAICSFIGVRSIMAIKRFL